MLPQVGNVIENMDKIRNTMGSQNDYWAHIVSLLLAASRFSNTTWKMACIKHAEEFLILRPTNFLHILCTYRKSILQRMSGDMTSSANVLDEFWKAIPTSAAVPGLTPQTNAHLGELVISSAENDIRSWKLESARSTLQTWTAFHQSAPSTLERIIQRAIDITLGKILRYQGYFEVALAHLTSAYTKGLEEDEFEGSGWFHVQLSNIADILCELGRPGEAGKLLQPEIELLLAQGAENIATGRRLRVAQAETLLVQKMYTEAERVLLDLLGFYSESAHLDTAAKHGFFRVLIGLARLHHLQEHWQGALDPWRNALDVAEPLNMGPGWNAGLVRLSMAHIHIKTGMQSYGRSEIQSARANLNAEGRMYWIACFNSTWYDSIAQSPEICSI